MPTTSQLQLYLEMTGWKHLHTTRVKSKVYGRNDYRSSLLLPTDKGLGDYTQLLDDVLHHISLYENIEIEKVKEKVLYAQRDIVRFRADSPLAKNGTLPLYAWEKHIDFTVRAIKVAASCIIKPTSNVKRLRAKDATSFASKCIIGQTEVGSYITKAMIPLGEYQGSLQEGVDASSTPSGRQLSSFILNGARIIASSSRELRNNITPIGSDLFANNKSLALVCERMCAAYEDVSEAFNDKVKLSINLSPSPSLPRTPDILKKPVILSSEYISEIKELKRIISNEFKPTHSHITGFVIGLIQDVDKDDVADGETIIRDGEGRKIHIVLESAMYSIAIDAHRNKLPISASGILKREKNKYYLDDPAEFKVL